ncbi:MAG: hypothetical protein BWY76_02916 [bacterium ADurb.Bin429]|nr:MAG: hypothetical protein BWY76_02916 [bacterium ADurb.Bin429]
MDAFPILRALAVVADLLRVEIGALGLDILQIHAHLLQHLLGDDGRQEAIQRGFRIVVGIADQIGQRIHHRSGQRGRVAHLQAAVLRQALGRHAQRHRAVGTVGANGAAVAVRLQHAMHVGREDHLHGVRFLVGERLHPHGGVVGGDHADAPVHARFAAGGDHRRALQRFGGRVHRLQRRAFQFQRHLHGLRRRQVVMHHGGEHHFVLLHEEARGLQAHHDVLPGDDLGGAFAHAGTVAHRPYPRFPGRQAVGHLHRQGGDAVGIRLHRRRPESGIGKVRAHGGRGHRRTATIECFITIGHHAIGGFRHCWSRRRDPIHSQRSAPRRAGAHH